VPSLNIPITAEDRTKRAFSSVLRSTEKLNKSFGGLGRTILGIAGAGGFGALSKNLINTADQLGKTSARLGVTTKELQALRFSAEQSGVEVKTFDTALQRFTRRSAEASKGTGETVKAFQELGISLFKNDGSLKSNSALLLEVADGLKNTTNQADRVRLAFKFFDAEGVKVVNMLQGGKENLLALQNQFIEAGGVISNDFIVASENLNDRLNLFSKILKGNLATAITGFVIQMQDAGGSMSGIKDFSVLIGKAVNFLIMGFRVLKTEIVFIINQLTKGFAGSFDVILAKAKLAFEGLKFGFGDTKKAEEELLKAQTKLNQDIADGMNARNKSLDLIKNSYLEGLKVLDAETQVTEKIKEKTKVQDESKAKIIEIAELEADVLDLYERDVKVYSGLVDQQKKGLDLTEESQQIFSNELDQRMKFFKAFDQALAQQRKRYQDIKKVTDTIFLLGIGPTSSKGAKFLREMVGQAMDLAGSLGGFVNRQGSAIMQAGGASGQRAMQVGKEFATKGVEAGIMALVLSNEKVQEALGKVFDALFELIDPIIDLLAPVIESLTEILVELKPLFELLIPVLRETMVPIKGLIHVMKQVIGPIVHLIKEIAKIFTPVGSLTDALNALASPLNALKNAIEKLSKTFSLGGGGSGNPVTNTVNKVINTVKKILPFADGGRVRGNRSILVGEEGPEVFTPNQNGTIIPNHDLGGQTVVNVFLDMEGQVKLPLHQYVSSVQRRAERSGNPQLAGILAG
tara:strand:- start:9752 stop:11986 length:2235 start_codon:yes stop_codon:yes gene_type:complete